MTNQCELFEPSADQADLLAAHLPIGGVFDSAREGGTNFRALIEALGAEYFRTEGEAYNTCEEMDPRITIDLLPEWERSVGIPDTCFSTAGDVERRREAVLLKLGGFRVQTAQDFIDLAALLGQTIEIEPGATTGTYPMKYSARYLGGAKGARFTMIVHFPDTPNTSYPQPYPVPYGVATGIVECVIAHAAPSNVNVIFSYGTTAP